MIRTSVISAFAALALGAGAAQAAPEQYKLDNGHTFITFKVSHIGYAWMPGVFHEFSGSLTYDPENRSNSKAEFTVQTASLDTFHSERDKHLRERDGLFETAEYPSAKFVSTAYEPTGPDTALLKGNLTIKGETRPVEFEVQEMAASEDPWGNFRRAFSATTTVPIQDFDLTWFEENGIPLPKTADIKIAVEALRQ